ncbi:NfeD family protein [Ilumatobacter nonamiensis]|uniref:NfeD family protein n=1 Tax=Ilumatobacter nonamiensis TaxID=467093 RepID=UPI000347178C|nr:NfeD family protein [Ilumatobacter nonamiensis]
MAAVLDLGIDLDAWPWIWLGVAAIFALVELTALAGTFVLLPFAVSAFLASIAGFYDASVEVQWGIFVIAGAILWWLFWRYLRRFVNDHAMPEGVGADRLIGTIAFVTADIDPDDRNRRGRVKVLGEEWGALTHETHLLPKGSKVRVTAMEGTRVMVEALIVPPPSQPPMAPPAAPPSHTSEET